MVFPHFRRFSHGFPMVFPYFPTFSHGLSMVRWHFPRFFFRDSQCDFQDSIVKAVEEAGRCPYSSHATCTFFVCLSIYIDMYITT